MDTDRSPHGTLPSVIATYQDAHDRRDVATALDQFTPDATVVDDGHTFRGRAGVESFLRNAASEYTFTRTLLDARQDAPGAWLVTNHLEGDFPGGVVDLRYEFRLTDGRISLLRIAP
jgi:SnoaL-like domain